MIHVRFFRDRHQDEVHRIFAWDQFAQEDGQRVYEGWKKRSIRPEDQPEWPVHGQSIWTFVVPYFEERET